ncbi:unnamed protein product [Nezara viridula]|uniref:Integrase zinc-binding domain-containing protein n=1 Tax=Nezara viridula TaxID=85310 RepID=A0A9P0EEF3_NEZVI|nr:unnamed protein product [Nezara viridula]
MDDQSDPETWKVMVPVSLRTSIINENHDSWWACHPGQTHTAARIFERLYWPDLRDHVATYVHNRHSCNMRKSPRGLAVPLGPLLEGSIKEYVSAIKNRLTDIHKKANESAREAWEIRTRNHDFEKTLHEYQEGELVYLFERVSHQEQSRKFRHSWSRPHKKDDHSITLKRVAKLVAIPPSKNDYEEYVDEVVEHCYAVTIPDHTPENAGHAQPSLHIGVLPIQTNAPEKEIQEYVTACATWEIRTRVVVSTDLHLDHVYKGLYPVNKVPFGDKLRGSNQIFSNNVFGDIRDVLATAGLIAGGTVVDKVEVGTCVDLWRTVDHSNTNKSTRCPNLKNQILWVIFYISRGLRLAPLDHRNLRDSRQAPDPRPGRLPRPNGPLLYQVLASRNNKHNRVQNSTANCDTITIEINWTRARVKY